MYMYILHVHVYNIGTCLSTRHYTNKYQTFPDLYFGIPGMLIFHSLLYPFCSITNVETLRKLHCLLMCSVENLTLIIRQWPMVHEYLLIILKVTDYVT